MNINLQIYFNKRELEGVLLAETEAKRDSSALGGQRRPLISLAGSPCVASAFQAESGRC